MLFKKYIQQQNSLQVEGDILTVNEKVTADCEKFVCEENSWKQMLEMFPLL